MSRRRHGPSITTPKAAAPSLPSWDRHTPLTMLVQWRGGAECWWMVKARGRTYHFPGHLALHDVMARIQRWSD